MPDGGKGDNKAAAGELYRELPSIAPTRASKQMTIDVPLLRSDTLGVADVLHFNNAGAAHSCPAVKAVTSHLAREAGTSVFLMPQRGRPAGSTTSCAHEARFIALRLVAGDRVETLGHQLLDDDALMAFDNIDDAKRVLSVLGKRLGRYGLTLHPDKTRLVDFRPQRSQGARPCEARLAFFGIHVIISIIYWSKL